MGWWTALISPIASLGKTWIEGRQLKANAKFKLEQIRLLGELERAKNLAKAEANYDLEAQRSMASSFKDEWLVILLSFPFLISFLTPYIAVFAEVDLVPALREAWLLVGEAPYWYQIAFLGIIAATFGLRWWISQTKLKGFQK